MFKRFLCFFYAALYLVMSVSSCVNEEYDISEGVDMEMTLLKNATLPIGDVEKITLDKIMLIEDESSIVTVDHAGNYSIDFSGDRISFASEIPTVSIGDYQLESSTVVFGTGPFAGLNNQIGSTTIAYSEIAGSPFSFDMDIEIDEDLPAEIKDIRKIVFTKDRKQITFDLSIPSGTLYVKKGFSFTFPDDIFLVPIENEQYKVTEHQIEFKTDIKVSGSKHFGCEFSIDSFVFPENSVNATAGNTELYINNHITVEGDMYISTDDYQTIPEEVRLVINTNIHDFEVEYAEVRLDLEIGISDTEFELGEIPEFLDGDNICIDLYDPQLYLNIYNGTPLSFDLSAGISSFSDDSMLAAIELGSYTIGAEEESNILISRREWDTVTGDGVYDVLPEIGDILSKIPEIIRIDDVTVACTEDLVQIHPDDTYSIYMDYGVYAPLSFGEDLSLEFTQDIENLNLSSDTGISSVELELVIVNSIPADFTISSQGVDNDGNIISDMTLTVDKTIAAGSHTSPTETSLTLTLKSASKTLELDGLRLDMKAKAGDAKYHGITLNKNQGLELKDIVLILPDGITFTNDSEN